MAHRVIFTGPTQRENGAETRRYRTAAMNRYRPHRAELRAAVVPREGWWPGQA